MDQELLLQNHGEDAPSGEDLEYDPTFAELEIAAQLGEERQAGDEIIAGVEPDYKEVAKLALNVLERSHDLRAGVFLSQAQLRLKGMPGFAEVTTFIKQMLEDYWGSCHPQLDADDDDDPTMRVNAVFALADNDRILKALRMAPLTKSRTFGMMSLRDIAVADGEITPPSDMDSVPDASSVAAAFQDTDEDTLREISTAVATALDDVQSISAKFDDETPGQGPDLDPLIKMLKKAKGRLTDALGGSASEEAADGNADESAEIAASAPRGAGGGAINSSTNVLHAIDQIIAYYQRTEPSSPVPMLLLRAKKLVNADFMTIVRDMAPGGVDNVNLISGVDDDD